MNHRVDTQSNGTFDEQVLVATTITYNNDGMPATIGWIKIFNRALSDTEVSWLSGW